MGRDNLSGASLRGVAKSYIGRYRQSGANLMERLKLNNIDVKEVISDHNRREIWVGYETHKRKQKEKYCEF